jgi:hypothetical protein
LRWSLNVYLHTPLPHPLHLKLILLCCGVTYVLCLVFSCVSICYQWATWVGNYSKNNCMYHSIKKNKWLSNHLNQRSKTCTMETMKHCWKKSKETKTNGNISHVWELKDSVVLIYPSRISIQNTHFSGLQVLCNPIKIPVTSFAEVREPILKFRGNLEGPQLV